MKKELLLLIILFLSQNVFSQSVNLWSDEEKAVLEIVDQFFDSMNRRDTATLRRIMTPEGRYYGMRDSNEGWTTHTSIHEKYINGLAHGNDVLQERIWSPEIKVHKTIAMLWAPYDIYVNGKFQHCGIDAFSLIKTKEGWKIASTVFTMEPEGCEDSPLGPLIEE